MKQPFIPISQKQSNPEQKMVQLHNCWIELQEAVQEIFGEIEAGRKPSWELGEKARARLITSASHIHHLMEDAPKSKPRIQEIVNDWLTEKIEEYDLNPVLMEGDTVPFTYERTEWHSEVHKGEVEFQVPINLLDRIADQGDSLKEFLDENCPSTLGLEMEYEDGDLQDTETKLT